MEGITLKEMKGIKERLKLTAEKRVFILKEMRRKDIMGFKFDEHFDFDNVGNLLTKDSKMYSSRKDIPDIIKNKMREISKKYYEKEDTLETAIKVRLNMIQQEEKKFKQKIPGFDLFYTALATRLTEEELQTNGKYINGAIEEIFGKLYGAIDEQKEMVKIMKEFKEKEIELNTIRNQTNDSAAETFNATPKNDEKYNASNDRKTQYKDTDHKEKSQYKEGKHEKTSNYKETTRPITLETASEEIKRLILLSATFYKISEDIKDFFSLDLGLDKLERKDLKCMETILFIIGGKGCNLDSLINTIQRLEYKNISNYDQSRKFLIEQIIGILKGYRAYLEK